MTVPIAAGSASDISPQNSLQSISQPHQMQAAKVGQIGSASPSTTANTNSTNCCGGAAEGESNLNLPEPSEVGIFTELGRSGWKDAPAHATFGKRIRIDDLYGEMLMEWRPEDIYAFEVENDTTMHIFASMKLRGKHMNPFKSRYTEHKDPFKRELREFTFKVGSKVGIGKWRKVLTDWTTPQYGPTKELLVVINPIGGRRRAKKMFEKVLRPMLKKAHRKYSVIETDHAGHAGEIARDLDLNKIGAVAAIGGDGLVYELVNGLAGRPDAEEVFRTLGVGQLPAGSHNSLAASGGMRQPLTAATAIVNGWMRPIDMMKVTRHLPDGPQVTLALCGLNYGFIAEVNVRSENKRFLGPTRYILAGAQTVFRGGGDPSQVGHGKGGFTLAYTGMKCRYLRSEIDRRLANPAPQYSRTKSAPIVAPEHSKLSHSHTSNPEMPPLESPLPPSETKLLRWLQDAGPCGTSCMACSVLHKLTTKFYGNSDDDKMLGPSPIVEEGEEGWVDIDDKKGVSVLSLTNVAVRNTEDRTCWMQNAHLASGYMELVTIPALDRFTFAQLLAKVPDNKHLKDSRVGTERVTSVIFEPTIKRDESHSDTKYAEFGIDGELIDSSCPLRADLLPGALLLMAPAWGD